VIKKTWIVCLGVLLLGAMLASGCAVATVQAGDTVRVHYTLAVEDGTVYDTTVGRDPAKFTLGQGKLIPGFEEALLGMRVGEAKTVTIPPEKAYGAHRPELVVTVSRSLLQAGLEPAVGQQLKTTIRGTPAVVVVTDVAETTVTVDANPVLAGQTLTFNIELVSIGEGLPPAAGLDQTSLMAMITVLLLLAVGLTFFYLGRRRRLQRVRAGRVRKSEGLLAEIARLDDDFEGGRIAEAAYRKVRAQKKTQLVQLMQRLKE
jgi:FKBP-type peptidyl-prolyl cis-trans isomerase 2